MNSTVLFLLSVHIKRDQVIRLFAASIIGKTQPNQALPEGIPLGQADGMSVVRNSWLMVG